MTDKTVTAERASECLRILANHVPPSDAKVDRSGAHECVADLRDFIDQHSQPACDRAERMEKALQEIKLRLHFAGWPAEPMWDAGEEGRPRWIADWRYEIDMLENALNGSERRYPERPHSVPRNQIPATPQPAGMDEAVERALSATVCDGEDVQFYLRASCIVPASNGEADEVCTDSLAREVVRTILTAAGLHALVAECERLRAINKAASDALDRAESRIASLSGSQQLMAGALAAQIGKIEQAEARAVESERLLRSVVNTYVVSDDCGPRERSAAVDDQISRLRARLPAAIAQGGGTI